MTTLELLTGDAEAVLTDLSRAYAACPGAPLYTASCVVCERPLASGPFQIHVLVNLEPCQIGSGHLIAGAVVRHLDCIADDDDHLYLAVTRVLRHVLDD